MKKKSLTGMLVFVLLFTGMGLPAGKGKEVHAQKRVTLGNPVIENGVSTWDCIYFGRYYQSDINGKVKEPLKWRVLSVKGYDVFLMADSMVDYQAMYDYLQDKKGDTWDHSTLRPWLNGEFLKSAFTKEERAAIKTTLVRTSANPYYGTSGGKDTKDKLYLASFEEVSDPDYGFPESYENKSEARMVRSISPYVAQRMSTYISSTWTTPIPYQELLGPLQWLLRNPARSDCIMFINKSGKEGANGLGARYHSAYGIRPVLHLDQSKTSLFTYAGRVTSTGQIIEPEKVSGELPVVSGQTDSVKPKIVRLADVRITSLKRKKSGSIWVKWKKVKGAKGYQLQYSTNKKLKKAKTVNTKKGSSLCKKLKKGKKYYFRVRAYRIVEKKKVMGGWSKVKKIKVK